MGIDRSATPDRGMSRRTTYARSPEILWRRVADDVLVLSPGAEAPAALSVGAALVWEGLDEPASLNRLRAVLAPFVTEEAGDFGVGLESVVERLVAAGLIVAVEDADD